MPEVIEGVVVDDAKPERSLAEWKPRLLVTVDEAVRQHEERIDYMRRVLKEGTHYGTIPGTGSKPTLLKPGAESLMADMGLRPDPVDEQPPVLDFIGRDHADAEGRPEPFIHYQRKVNLYRLHPQTGERIWVGSGSGSCNSWEDKYRWRTSTRLCPECGKPAIIKGKAEYGGGWICFRKKDGCGAKFPDNAVSITSQNVGKVANDRIADLSNTILKMADKRALVAAVLNTTGVSDLFTQDMDDEGDAYEHARAEETRNASPSATPKRTAPTTPAAPSVDIPSADAKDMSKSDLIHLFNAHSKDATAYCRDHSLPLGVAAMTEEQRIELAAFLMVLPS